MTNKLVKIDKFAPSQNPYWFYVNTLDKGKVESIWFGRKKGKTIVTYGKYHVAMFDEYHLSLEDALDRLDPCYRGDWIAQWDGENIKCNPRHGPFSPNQIEDLSEFLSLFLNDREEMVKGSDEIPIIGPYYKVKRDYKNA